MAFSKKQVGQRYVAASRAPYSDSEAEVIGSELERMAAEGIPVVPGTIVDEARPDEAVLHPHFDWDDAEAAEKWRREQARNLVNCLDIVYIKPSGEEGKSKAFLSVTVEEVKSDPEAEKSPEREYIAVFEVQSSPPLRDQMLRGAVQEFRAWAAKYRALGLTELQPVFEAANWLEK